VYHKHENDRHPIVKFGEDGRQRIKVAVHRTLPVVQFVVLLVVKTFSSKGDKDFSLCQPV
jgi:hypothetical protein